MAWDWNAPRKFSSGDILKYESPDGNVTAIGVMKGECSDPRYYFMEFEEAQLTDAQWETVKDWEGKVLRSTSCKGADRVACRLGAMDGNLLTSIGRNYRDRYVVGDKVSISNYYWNRDNYSSKYYSF